MAGIQEGTYFFPNLIPFFIYATVNMNYAFVNTDMGMSRSGRVRKKSSKLMDFESPEEADFRPKKCTRMNSYSKILICEAKLIFLLFNLTYCYSYTKNETKHKKNCPNG